MMQDRITAADLEWWLAKSADLEWTSAKTYAKTAPHSYVVRGRTSGMTDDDYVRAGRVIHTFGQPAKFYDRTDIYLEARGVKWWTMDRDVRDTALINQASSDRLYGVQNAPMTKSLFVSPFDELASGWDVTHPTSDALAADLEQAFARLRSTYLSSVLDFGCGTGRILDLGLVRPERYAGIDASGAMLNQLVRKHPRVAAVYPLQLGTSVAPWFTYGQFEIVTTLMPLGYRLDPALIQELRQVASGGMVVADGDTVTILDPGPRPARSPQHNGRESLL